MKANVVDYNVNMWLCLESSRGLTAVAAGWRERLCERFEPFKNAVLPRAPGVAKGMPCARGCACTHEIVTSKGEGEEVDGGELIVDSASPRLDTRSSSVIRAVCRCDPPNCPDIPLTADDIVLFELSWNKLARSLCRAFSLDHKPVDLGLLNTRQIGSWSVD